MNVRPRPVVFVLAGAAAIAAAALLVTKHAARPARAAPPAADAHGLDASGRTRAEQLAVEEALVTFKKEGLILRAAEDGDAAESDEHRDLEEVYGGYHPFFVRGDLDGDGRLDFAQAFVEKGSSGAWFHVAVFFGNGDGTFQKPLWVERAISLGRRRPDDRALAPHRDARPRARSDAPLALGGRRKAVRRRRRRFPRHDPADEDAPDETPDQKPRARV